MARDSNEAWKVRHGQALQTVQLAPSALADRSKAKAETAIVAMMKGLQMYAQAHKEMYENRIADDGVLGDHWENIAHGLRGLLNGELGRLDGGMTDRAISDALRSAGFNPDVQGETLPEEE